MYIRIRMCIYGIQVYCNVLREIKEYFSRIVNGIEPFPFFLCSVLRKDRNIVEEVILLLTFEGDEGNKTVSKMSIYCQYCIIPHTYNLHRIQGFRLIEGTRCLRSVCLIPSLKKKLYFI